METPGGLKFEVGELAELKTFAEGYRGAWFRCKIRDINLKKNKIQLEYYDFEEEEISWEKIHDVPPYGRKSRNVKKQLMLRPRYPLIYKKNEMPHANSISEVCVVIDGTWKVGDMVDWYYDSSYWTAMVIEVLSDDKVQIELPMPPAGEGKEDETHEAFCEDLRPCLEWSQRKGWTLPTVEGKTSCGARLIFPSKQGMDQDLIYVGSPLKASSSTCISAKGDTVRRISAPLDAVVCGKKLQNVDLKMDGDSVQGNAETQTSVLVNTVIFEEKVQAEDVKMGDDFAAVDTEKQSSNLVDTVICEEKVQIEDVKMGDDFAERDTERQSSNLLDTVICEEKVQIEDVKMDDECMESSNSISSLLVEENKSAAAAVANEGGIHFSGDLNIMHEDTLEAGIIDLEELANKIKWMQNLLNSNGSQSSIDSSSWKFV